MTRRRALVAALLVAALLVAALLTCAGVRDLPPRPPAARPAVAAPTPRAPPRPPPSPAAPTPAVDDPLARFDLTADAPWTPRTWLVASFDPTALRGEAAARLTRAWQADQGERPLRYPHLLRALADCDAPREVCALFTAATVDVDAEGADPLAYREALADAIDGPDADAAAQARDLWLSSAIPDRVTPRILEVSRALVRDPRVGRVDLGVALAIALVGDDVATADALLPRLRAAMDDHCVGPDATCRGWRDALLAEAFVARAGGAPPTDPIAGWLAAALRCWDAGPPPGPVAVTVSPDAGRWRLDAWAPDAPSPFRTCLTGQAGDARGAEEAFRLTVHAQGP